MASKREWVIKSDSSIYKIYYDWLGKPIEPHKPYYIINLGVFNTIVPLPDDELFEYLRDIEELKIDEDNRYDLDKLEFLMQANNIKYECLTAILANPE